MPAYTFSRSSSKLRNTTISGPDNVLLYEIVTPKTGLFEPASTTVWRHVPRSDIPGSSTTITNADTNADTDTKADMDTKEEGLEPKKIKVAVLEWHTLSEDLVTFLDAPSAPMKTFLVKPSFWSRCVCSINRRV